VLPHSPAYGEREGSRHGTANGKTWQEQPDAGGDAAAAEHYAEIRAELKRKGQSIGANDLMIAAHARSEGAVVVTNNEKDFGRVKGLKLENWTRQVRA